MDDRRVGSASSFEVAFGFCRGRRIGPRIEIAGTAPIPQDGAEPPAGSHEQMLLCGAIAVEAIERLGGSVGDVVRTRMYIVDRADAEAIGRAHRIVFGSAEPVSTMVVVAGLLDPAWRVEIEVEAHARAETAPPADAD